MHIGTYVHVNASPLASAGARSGPQPPNDKEAEFLVEISLRKQKRSCRLNALRNLAIFELLFFLSLHLYIAKSV